MAAGRSSLRFWRDLAAAGVPAGGAGRVHPAGFLNGRMDLTEVEGLADLIAAETEAQRRQALRQARGRSGQLFDGWRERLIRARALVEAELDFADEEDVPGSVSRPGVGGGAGDRGEIAAASR